MNVLGRWIFMVVLGLLAMQAHAQYYAGSGQTFTCRSDNFRQSYCAADTRGGVSLVRQVSNSACIEGRTWGYDNSGVWVTEGCAGEFALGGRYNEGYAGRYGYNDVRVIRCESNDNRQQYCRIDTRGGVRLARQISGSACIRGQSWDYDGGGVWVSNGCRADFTVGGYGDGYRAPGYGVSRTVRCESTGNRSVRCNIDTRGGVRLVRRLSSSPCYQGRSWDWDRSGIWVSSGCRAEFQVGGFHDGRDDDRNYDDRR
jgi:hypothetical protein